MPPRARGGASNGSSSSNSSSGTKLAYGHAIVTSSASQDRLKRSTKAAKRDSKLRQDNVKDSLFKFLDDCVDEDLILKMDDKPVPEKHQRKGDLLAVSEHTAVSASATKKLERQSSAKKSGSQNLNSTEHGLASRQRPRTRSNPLAKSEHVPRRNLSLEDDALLFATKPKPPPPPPPPPEEDDPFADFPTTPKQSSKKRNSTGNESQKLLDGIMDINDALSPSRRTRKSRSGDSKARENRRSRSRKRSSSVKRDSKNSATSSSSRHRSPSAKSTRSRGSTSSRHHSPSRRSRSASARQRSPTTRSKQSSSTAAATSSSSSSGRSRNSRSVSTTRSSRSRRHTDESKTADDKSHSDDKSHRHSRSHRSRSRTSASRRSSSLNSRARYQQHKEQQQQQKSDDMDNSLTLNDLKLDFNGSSEDHEGEEGSITLTSDQDGSGRSNRKSSAKKLLHSPRTAHISSSNVRSSQRRSRSIGPMTSVRNGVSSRRNVLADDFNQSGRINQSDSLDDRRAVMREQYRSTPEDFSASIADMAPGQRAKAALDAAMFDDRTVATSMTGVGRRPRRRNSGVEAGPFGTMVEDDPYHRGGAKRRGSASGGTVYEGTSQRRLSIGGGGPAAAQRRGSGLGTSYSSFSNSFRGLEDEGTVDPEWRQQRASQIENILNNAKDDQLARENALAKEHEKSVRVNEGCDDLMFGDDDEDQPMMKQKKMETLRQVVRGIKKTGGLTRSAAKGSVNVVKDPKKAALRVGGVTKSVAKGTVNVVKDPRRAAKKVVGTAKDVTLGGVNVGLSVGKGVAKGGLAVTTTVARAGLGGTQLVVGTATDGLGTVVRGAKGLIIRGGKVVVDDETNYDAKTMPSRRRQSVSLLDRVSQVMEAPEISESEVNPPKPQSFTIISDKPSMVAPTDIMNMSTTSFDWDLK